MYSNGQLIDQPGMIKRVEAPAFATASAKTDRKDLIHGRRHSVGCGNAFRSKYA
jgi:hypothetical protein